jgi:hypothetical protein
MRVTRSLRTVTPLARFKLGWLLTGWNLAGTGALLAASITLERGLATAAVFAAANSAGWLLGPATASLLRPYGQRSAFRTSVIGAAAGRTTVFIAYHQDAPLWLLCLLAFITQGIYTVLVGVGKQQAHLHRGTASSSETQAALGLWGGVGAATAVLAAGAIVGDGAAPTTLLIAGTAYSTLGMLPLLPLIGATAPPAETRPAASGGAGRFGGAKRDGAESGGAGQRDRPAQDGSVRRHLSVTAAVSCLVGGFESIAVAAATAWYSSRWAGLTRIALLLGQMAAARLSRWVESRPNRHRAELWLLAATTTPIAVADRSVWLLLAWLAVLGAGQRSWQASREAWMFDREHHIMGLLAARSGGGAISAAWVGAALATAGATPVGLAVGITLLAAGAATRKPQQSATHPDMPPGDPPQHEPPLPAPGPTPARTQHVGTVQNSTPGKVAERPKALPC